VLSPEEIATLEMVWSRWQGVSTAEIVGATHDEVPWQSAEMYETIPYHMAHFL